MNIITTNINEAIEAVEEESTIDPVVVSLGTVTSTVTVSVSVAELVTLVPRAVSKEAYNINS